MTAVLLTVRQAHEVSRFSDRHGPASIAELPDGRVLLGLDVADARRATHELILDPHGRVDTWRRRQDAPPPAPTLDGAVRPGAAVCRACHEPGRPFGSRLLCLNPACVRVHEAIDDTRTPTR